MKRRSGVAVTPMWIVAAWTVLGIVSAGCQRSRSVPDAGATPSRASEGRATPADAATNEAGASRIEQDLGHAGLPSDPAYPGPEASSGPRPPSLHQPVAGLAAGISLRPEGVWSCPRTETASPDRSLALVPATTPEGQDLLAIASDRAHSVVGWRLSEALPPGHTPADLEVAWAREAWLAEPAGSGGTTVVMQATRLRDRAVQWVLDCSDAGDADELAVAATRVRVLAALSVDERTPIDPLGWLGLSPSDRSTDAPRALLLQTGSEGMLYADRGTGLWEPVLSVDEGYAWFDYDRDGRREVIEPLEDGAWRVREWTGTAIEETRLVDEATAPPVIDTASLPALPVDLYLEWGADSAEPRAWRWPAAGGALEAVASESSPSRLDWQQLDPPRERMYDASRDGRVQVVFRDAAIDGLPSVTVDPVALPESARRSGEIRIATDGADVASTIAVFDDVGADPDVGLRGFMGLRLSDAGDRLAWADGVGLWALDLPAGRPRRLTPWESLFPDGAEGTGGLHRPAAWSPDGRFLLVDIGYFEGSAWGLWDVDAGRFSRIPDSFGYVGGYSELGWLSSGRLLHARSGDESGGTTWMRLLDPADLASDTILPPLLPEDGGGSVWVSLLGFAERPDGDIVFGLRSSLPFDRSSNGFFRIHPDGSGLERIAGLPDAPIEAKADGQVGGVDCGLRLSPDGSIFLCLSPVGYSWPRDVLGRVETGEIWDVTPVFHPAPPAWVRAVGFAPVAPSDS